MAKKKTPTIKDLSKDRQKLFNVLNNENDLSAILIATSFIDTCLASLLAKKLKKSSVSDKMLSFNGMVGSMSSRADLCYVLDLIPKEMYKDLLLLMEMRNVVAHNHLQLDFGKDEIKELCRRMKYVETLKNGDSSDPLILQEYLHLTRNKFLLTVTTISQRLMLIGLGLNREENL